MAGGQSQIPDLKKHYGGKKNMKISSMAIAKMALFAAVYAALTLLLFPLSYGGVQVRISEALTVLAVFSPICIGGLTAGCFLANFLGFIFGANPMPLDMLLGTLATFLAAVLTYGLRKVCFKEMPVLAWLPPVLINGIIIGLELCFLTAGHFEWRLFLLQAGYICLGQLVACLGLGMPLCWIIQKKGLQKLFLQ